MGIEMTQDEIIRMAMQAGMDFKGGFGLVIECVTLPELERFAALVAAHEREACAQFLESDLMSFASSAECAAAIRARGDK